MLTARCPREAYRRIEFDARVGVADGGQLVSLCCEQLIAALGTALFAHAAADTRLKSRSLTRALAAVTALQLGVIGEDGIAAALRQLYIAAHRTILDAVLAFDPTRLSGVRQDFIEIAAAFSQSARQASGTKP